MNNIKQQFGEAHSVLIQFISNPENFKKIDIAGSLLIEAFRRKNKAISCGNGGSMCDAIHFAEELAGRFREDRKALPAVAISDPGFLSCTANDYGYAKVFSRYIEAFGQPGDVLLAISTSGNSENVLNAIVSAKSKGMKVIGLTGKDGGKMGALCDVEIRAPFSKYADRAQEIHIKVIHTLISYVEARL
jgi:D-sedoheptulose 7-phosphate isomerase